MSSDKKSYISPINNGPLEVAHIEQIDTSDGAIKLDSPAYLCRCGASKNKPFCDGTHKKINFDSSKSDDRVQDNAREYAGKKIVVHFNRGVCAHVGFCLKSLPNVFDLKARPWIQADNADVEEVIKTVNNCPSGALSYTIKGFPFPEDATDNTIYLIPNGPYLVRGNVELQVTKFGEKAVPSKYALCRCGKSKNKPFCDGTHHQVKFE